MAQMCGGQGSTNRDKNISLDRKSDHKEFFPMLQKTLEGAVILESFPKTTVDVFALVLESGDIMASLRSKIHLFSSFCSNSQVNRGQRLLLPRRGFHIELGVREKALLEEDPALKKFKSHKKAVGQVKRLGDALIIAVVAACSYEIYVNAVEKRAQFEETHQSNLKNV